MAEWIQTPESSHVSSIKYDGDAKEVSVQFHGGDIYRYKNVPENVWNEFLGSDSKGRFIHVILTRQYEYEKA